MGVHPDLSASDVPEAALKFAKWFPWAGRAPAGLGREALALWHVGIAHWYAGNLDEASQQFELALALTQEAGDSRNEAVLKRSIGRIHEDRGELAAAREWFESSLAVFDELGDEREQKRTREAIGRVAREKHD
jgi:tetratricopeptide (TPR) repeat protein